MQRLEQNGWKRHNGKTTTFAKDSYQETDFRLLGKKKETNLSRVLAHLEKKFSSYANREPCAPVNEHGEPIFIGAGVQNTLNALVAGEKIDAPEYLAQPCIRMSARENLSAGKYTSSFINVCTQHVNATQEEHEKHFEQWLSVLSSFGLYVGHMKVVETPWGTNAIKGRSHLIYYGNLSLGDAVLINEYEGKPVSISDIGFGAERIVWAQIKTKQFRNTFAPWSARNNFAEIDGIRTLTLMAGNDIRPSNKGAGYRMKQIARDLCDAYDITELATHFSKQWNEVRPLAPDTPERVLAFVEDARVTRLEAEKNIRPDVPSLNSYLQQLYFRGK